MAHMNTYVCVVCGQKHEYCPRCNITHPNYDATRFCSQAHADIFEILSKNGCGLATAEETLKALESYDLTGLTEGVQAHINSLKPTKAEVKTKEVKEPEMSKKFRGQE